MAADLRRWRVLGGVAGPALFIAAWAVLGSTRTGYSPVDDPVSRLAATGTSSRPIMTLGLVAFGGGVLAFASELGRALGTGVGRMAAATAAATLGVALVPLGSSVDGLHAAVAGLAYTALAATPLVAAPSLARQGRRRAAVASVAAGAASAGALLTSALVSDAIGLWQRIGLTLGDAWFMATALWLAFGWPRPAARPAPG
jgi:Protein of unknown function (DUF998)